MDPALVHEALRPYLSEPPKPPDLFLTESAKRQATVKTLEQCERDFKLRMLSRATAQKKKLDGLRPDPSQDELTGSDGEIRRRNHALVQSLQSHWFSRAAPPQVDLMARLSRPDHSRGTGASASTAQLLEEALWKLDAYDRQPKQMREKYYASTPGLSRNEGGPPPGGHVGGTPAAEPSAYVGATTGSSNYDASRDPRLQR